MTPVAVHAAGGANTYIRRCRFLVLLIPVTLFGGGCLSQWPRVEVRDEVMVGNELRILAETSVNDGGSILEWWSPSVHHICARGYLVTVDVSSSAPLVSRAKVIGPLWKFEDWRTTHSIRFDGFDPARRQLGIGDVITLYQFDHRSGALLRMEGRPAGGCEWKELITTNGQPRWVHAGDFSTNDWARVPFDDKVYSADGRYRLHRKDGKAVLIDVMTGERRPDPWLEQVFLDEAAIPDFGHLRHYLSSDLRYYAACPNHIWNNGGRLIEEFALGSNTYSRNDVFLFWERDQRIPRVIQKPRGKDPNTPNPDPDMRAFTSDTDSTQLSATKALPSINLEELFRRTWNSRFVPRGRVYIPVRSE